MRTVAGVTSTHSSSRQNSSACSSDSTPVRDQRHQHVAGRLPHVGELLLLGRVDVHVVRRGSSRRRSCPRTPRCPARRTSSRAPAGWPARSRSSRRAGRRPATRSGGCGCRRPTARSPRGCGAAGPVPRVSVRNSVRKPIRPRAGTRYSIRIQPVPWSTICSSRPLRSASSWMTTPWYSDGTSIVIRSIGSCSLPSIVRVTTCGLPTVISKPSRRMISTRIASCSSPRPCTSQVSGPLGRQHADRHVADELGVEPVRSPAGR